MEREIIKIDEELCNGCGDCVPNCHEGALQVIDGKVRLVSELMCDGLGACIGHCPVGAITIEKREAQPYDEVLTIKAMIAQGKNTIIAHLSHLKDHGQTEFLHQGVGYLESVKDKLPFDINEVKAKVHHGHKGHEEKSSGCGGGCPGSQAISFGDVKLDTKASTGSLQSQLRQWPVQMHLINPMAPYFQQSDLLIAADCVAFSMGNFHQDFLKGRSLAIACPKLDSNQESYIQKTIALIEQAKVNTITVMIMQVPCCGGLLQMVRQATSRAARKVPVKAIIIGLEGEILSEEWL